MLFTIFCIGLSFLFTYAGLHNAIVLMLLYEPELERESNPCPNYSFGQWREDYFDFDSMTATDFIRVALFALAECSKPVSRVQKNAVHKRH